MNKKKNDYGVTLIELVVAVAILALLGTAIVGIMGSNTAIFRKNKADIGIQKSAQETYNQLYEDLSQANYVYIEGYISSNNYNDATQNIVFNNHEVGKDTSDTLEFVKLLRTSDQYLIELGGASGTVQSYVTALTGTGVNRESVHDVYYNALSDSVSKTKFDTFYENLRSMDSIEARRYAEFLDHIKSINPSGGYTSFDSNKLTDGNKYKKFYITKIVMEMSIPIPEDDISNNIVNSSDVEFYEKGQVYSYDTGTSIATASDLVNSYHADDYCICEYTFSGKEVSCTKDYKAYNDLDISAPNNIFNKNLNYVNNTDSSGTDTAGLSGVVGYFDAKNDAMMFDMHFIDRNRAYNSKGMTYFRNSYTLHDSK